MNDIIIAYGGSSVADESGQLPRAVSIEIRLVRAFAVMSAARPLLILLALVAVSLINTVEPALAQSVLGGDASKPIRAVRRAVDVAMWLTLGMGIFGLCWAGWNKTTGKAWGGQALGGALCLGISGVIAFVNQIVNGEAPDLGEF